MILFAAPVSAQLMVSPTRVVLEGTRRASQLEIINSGSKAATYRIALVNRRMDEAGTFSPVDAPGPGEQFADRMLRYSPRRVTLAPGASQVIRLMAARPADLAPGEYRSHLLFSEQPASGAAATALRDEAAGDEPADGIGIALTALVGVSIPIIVRSGETSAAVALANVALTDMDPSGPALTMDIQRSGSQSVYGDVAIHFTPTGGRPAVLAQAAGVAVYVPNALRNLRVALPTSATRLGPGVLNVQYRARPDEGGAVLAEAQLPVR